jgi:hypothetical protein
MDQGKWNWCNAQPRSWASTAIPYTSTAREENRKPKSEPDHNWLRIRQTPRMVCSDVEQPDLSGLIS